MDFDTVTFEKRYSDGDNGEIIMNIRMVNIDENKKNQIEEGWKSFIDLVREAIN